MAWGTASKSPSGTKGPEVEFPDSTNFNYASNQPDVGGGTQAMPSASHPRRQTFGPRSSAFKGVPQSRWAPSSQSDSFGSRPVASHPGSGTSSLYQHGGRAPG